MCTHRVVGKMGADSKPPSTEGQGRLGGAYLRLVKNALQRWPAHQGASRLLATLCAPPRDAACLVLAESMATQRCPVGFASTVEGLLFAILRRNGGTRTDDQLLRDAVGRLVADWYMRRAEQLPFFNLNLAATQDICRNLHDPRAAPEASALAELGLSALDVCGTLVVIAAVEFERRLHERSEAESTDTMPDLCAQFVGLELAHPDSDLAHNAFRDEGARVD